MKSLRSLIFAAACAVALASSAAALSQNPQTDPNKKADSCCAMKDCCKKDVSCCKDKDHACCKGDSCCCKGDSCPMKHDKN